MEGGEVAVEQTQASEDGAAQKGWRDVLADRKCRQVVLSGW